MLLGFEASKRWKLLLDVKRARRVAGFFLFCFFLFLLFFFFVIFFYQHTFITVVNSSYFTGAKSPTVLRDSSEAGKRSLVLNLVIHFLKF